MISSFMLKKLILQGTSQGGGRGKALDPLHAVYFKNDLYGGVQVSIRGSFRDTSETKIISVIYVLLLSTLEGKASNRL